MLDIKTLSVVHQHHYHTINYLIINNYHKLYFSILLLKSNVTNKLLTIL